MFSASKSAVNSEKNFMQRETLLIIKKLKTAALRYAEFDFVTARYVQNHNDPDAEIVGGEGILIQFNHFPGNARVRNGLAVEPMQFILYYSLETNPDIGALLNNINIDFATINISLKYPELKIRGVSIPDNALKVASPFSATDTISIVPLNLFLDMNSGTFFVEKFKKVANAVIITKLKSNAQQLQAAGHPAMTLVEAPLIVWEKSFDKIDAPKFFPEVMPPKKPKPETVASIGTSLRLSK